MTRFNAAASIAVVSILALPSLASAQSDRAGTGGQGPTARAKGKPKTLVVCKSRRCRLRTIGAAVRRAQPGDKIVVRKGVYRESVTLRGTRYRGVKLIGDPKRPRSVRIDGARLRGAGAQSAVLVDDADDVTVSGIYARNFKANGFVVTNSDGYRLTDVVAGRTGVYGLYVFNSTGGRIADAEAFANGGAGVYIGQTPRQVRPRRTLVKRVRAHANVTGLSATNMRYVTVAASDFFNNGTGVASVASDSERFPPPQQNVITGNRIFWNNFNHYRAAPFTIPRSGPAGLRAHPVGTGVLLFGGQSTAFTRNDVFGNWLVGLEALEQVVLRREPSPTFRDAAVLRDNEVRNNRFGLGGRDRNGRDLLYDGSGTGNCFASNELTGPTVPANPSVFAACPKRGANALDGATQTQALSWLPAGRSRPGSAERHWIRHPHARRKGIRPLVRYRKRAPKARARTAAARRTIRVGDDYFSPKQLRVRRGTTLVWKWLSANSDSHDVLLRSRPRGVKRFRSATRSTGYSFKRRLRKPGRYSFICTLHANMRQTVAVTR